MSLGKRLPSNPRVAVVGATGAVGIEIIRALEQRNFPVKTLRLLASSRSAGKSLTFRGEMMIVEELTDAAFDGIDLALFSAGGETSRTYVPIAIREGAVAVDNSSAFRMKPEVPLVVPEINGQDIAWHPGVIANPNCAAIITGTPLWPLHRAVPLRRLIVSTYQAASGAGAAAMQELLDATRAYLDGRAYEPRVLPHPYAFNLFSHNTAIDPETGYNGEETKVAEETRKIFGTPALPVSATCIRVPVLRAHAISITAEFERPVTAAWARAVLSGAPGVRLVDHGPGNHFPMPIEVSGRDDIDVGRIRQDLSDPSGHSLSLFVAGDQLLKGAALNAVQIAELLLNQ